MVQPWYLKCTSFFGCPILFPLMYLDAHSNIASPGPNDYDFISIFIFIGTYTVYDLVLLGSIKAFHFHRLEIQCRYNLTQCVKIIC